jgi:hypothetical protein
MTPLPFHPARYSMSFNTWSLPMPLIRASRAKATLGIGAVSRGQASRAYKPRGNAPPA